MKLGLMQPYFFPYLGYFDLIYQTDLWIVFDTVQYIRRGWMNRNRVLHPHQGWQYITVPVRKHPRHTPIRAIRIADDLPWRQKIMGQLQHYRKHAPYFSQTMDLVTSCLESHETSLARLNVRCLQRVCEYLDLDFNVRFLSEMNLQLGPINAPDDWALQIALALGAEEYVNPPGGEGLYDAQKFADAGVKLTIRHLPPMEYACPGYEFIPNLSIIDVLMWNDPAQVRAHLERHR
jgi:hypothetical protein